MCTSDRDLYTVNMLIDLYDLENGKEVLPAYGLRI